MSKVVNVGTVVVDVSKVLEKKGCSGYPAVGGYTIGKNAAGKFCHVIAARKGKDNPEGLLLQYSPLNPASPTTAEINIVTHHDMGHANDLTWNGGSYFLAKGGGETYSTDIIKYGQDLFSYGTARYLCGDPYVGSRLGRVSCISYFKDAHFILGMGLEAAPCLFRDNVFSQIKNISIDDPHIKREEFTERQPQGTCIFNNYYYKVFSYKANAGTKHNKNAIARYKIETSSDGVSITGLRFDEVYYCDGNNNIKFEIEDIAVDGAGQFYVLINQTDSAGGELDRVYEISL